MAAEIKYSPQIADVQAAICQSMASSLVSTKDQPVLLFLSGGSCFRLLPLLQPLLFAADYQFPHLTIAMVDERYDQDQSNFVTLQREYQAFYQTAIAHGVSFLNTSPQFNNQYEMADWYEETMRCEMLKVKSQKLKVITLLGMGPDGHIAGILPFPDTEEKIFYSTFLDTPRLVVGYDATGKNQFTKRYTLTFPGLLLSDQIFVYVVGEEKKVALMHAFHDNPPLHTCPAYFLQLTSQPTQLFTTIRL